MYSVSFRLVCVFVFIWCVKIRVCLIICVNSLDLGCAVENLWISTFCIRYPVIFGQYYESDQFKIMIWFNSLWEGIGRNQEKRFIVKNFANQGG